MRTPIIAANWKMHKTPAEALAFAKEFAELVREVEDVEIVIAPPYPALAELGRALAGTGITLAAQNVHPEPAGAFTGEVSVGMLSELGCRYVIVGHSERRALFGETDAFISAKLQAAQDGGLRPILCVGETLVEREAGRTFEVVSAQLAGSLARVDDTRAEELVIAYEPVWAIGTGRTATPELAQEVHAHIRSQLGQRFAAAAEAIRIQYGGSVKPESAEALLSQPDIDGGLVGGASLDPASFCAIIRFRNPARE
ncbi:MAG: triose-phosphate isomerase [Myxococcota bacterium]